MVFLLGNLLIHSTSKLHHINLHTTFSTSVHMQAGKGIASNAYPAAVLKRTERNDPLFADFRRRLRLQRERMEAPDTGFFKKRPDK